MKIKSTRNHLFCVGVVIKGLENVQKAVAHQIPNFTNQISTGYSTLNGRPIKVTLLDKEEDIYCLDLDINTHTEDSLCLAKYLGLPQAFVFCAVGYTIEEDGGKIIIDVDDLCNKINALGFEPKAEASVIIQDLIKSKDKFMHFANVGKLSDGLRLSLSLDINQELSCVQEDLKLIITTKPTGSCELGFYLGIPDEQCVKMYKRIHNPAISNHAVEVINQTKTFFVA